MQFQQTAAFRELIERQKQEMSYRQTNSSNAIRSFKMLSFRNLKKEVPNQTFKTPVTLPNLMIKINQKQNQKQQQFNYDSLQNQTFLKNFKLKVIRSNILQKNKSNNTNIEKETHEKTEQSEMNLTFGGSMIRLKKPVNSSSRSQLDLREISYSSSRVMSRSQKRLVQKIFN